MTEFQSPTDLKHNRGMIADPQAFAQDAKAASWLYLCGNEFAAMEGGMSYAEVERAGVWGTGRLPSLGNTAQRLSRFENLARYRRTLPPHQYYALRRR